MSSQASEYCVAANSRLPVFSNAVVSLSSVLHVRSLRTTPLCTLLLYVRNGSPAQIISAMELRKSSWLKIGTPAYRELGLKTGMTETHFVVLFIHPTSLIIDNAAING